MRHFFAVALLIVALIAIMGQRAEAGSGLRLKKLVKYGLIANALTGKKILFPLPLPLPIPVFQENVHHTPYPVNHHTHAEIGYGYEQQGYGHGGGYGGGYGGGLGGIGGGGGYW